MAQWADFPWGERLYTNADEAILTRAVAALENGYVNPAGGDSRFPGLEMFTAIPGANRVYLSGWRDNLVAATDRGRVYRIGQDGQVDDVTGVPLSGGRRAVFSATEDQVVMAAGGPILSLNSGSTAILSKDAPDTTHIGFIDGYLLATEPYSGRFRYCAPGDYSNWSDPLAVFTANGKPDDVVALQVTPFREIMAAGTDHIDQFEPLANGTQPFSRRWSTGEGLGYPYTLITDVTGTFGVNKRFQFVRFYGQISQNQAVDVGLTLEQIDDWTDAWAQELSVKGQQFFILQMPQATNCHGSKGVTLAIDYRNHRWSQLYGWDATLQRPGRWPCWSFFRMWGRVFAGVPGGIASFSDKAFDNLGAPAPFLIRTGHVDKFGPSRIDDVRIRMKRGAGGYAPNQTPQVGLRVNRDNEGFDQWQYEPLGLDGDRTMVLRFGGQGVANAWQFEIMVSDPVSVETVKMEVQVERMKW